MVGSPQAIECKVSTVSGVELSSVMISWMGPHGSLIADNNRIIVSPVTSFGNNYTSAVHFIYLMEGDEGLYTCNVMILETTQNSVVVLDNLICKYMYYVFYKMTTISNVNSNLITTHDSESRGQEEAGHTR